MKQGDFTEVAKHYHNRPAYSSFLLKKLIACVNENNKDLSNFDVLEVGAGTGKLTAMLGDFKLCINAVEPNDAMREIGIQTTKSYSNITWQKGSAENTGMKENSQDWVIMASSFHWSDPQKSLPEFARVLRGGGDTPAGFSQPFGIHAF